MRTYHKGVFVRNNANGFEYRLPDEHHNVSVYNYSNSVVCYVINTIDLKYKEEIRIDKNRCPTWEDIVWGFEELANKKYGRVVRHKNNEYRHKFGL